MSTSTVPRLAAIALDCPDPAALAEFYAQLLGWPAPSSVEEGGEWVTLPNPNGGVDLAFQRAADFQAPTWPDAAVQQQLHLDLAVDDIEASHERAVALGARHLDTQETFRVYADPVGHPFCLCGC